MDLRPETGEDALADALAEPRPASGPLPSIDELVAAQDIDGLIELGAAYRAGTHPEGRSLFNAMECFEAASTLGSADAEYLVGIAYLNGLGIAADPAEGAKRLRSSAQRGSLRAKVYVANLYELGVHYALDREKADVWYRNVARAANLEEEPGTNAYELAMAEIGCVRYCLSLVADASLPKKDRAFYLKKAKAMGYGLRLKEVQSESAALEASLAPTPVPAPAAPESPIEAPATDAAEAAPRPAPAPREEEEEEVLLGAQWTFGAGLLAFFAASFFAAASAVAAFLANEGSRTLLLHGRPVPGVGAHHEIVLGGVLVALGVLPAMAVYRPKVVAVAALLGAGGAAGAYSLHPSYPLLWDAPAQAGAGGLAVFLATLFVLGLLGGTRARPTRAPSRATRARERSAPRPDVVP